MHVCHSYGKPHLFKALTGNGTLDEAEPGLPSGPGHVGMAGLGTKLLANNMSSVRDALVSKASMARS